MKQQEVNINTIGMWDSRYSGGQGRVFPYEVLYEIYLNKVSASSVADYGCGLGLGIEYLAKQPNYSDTTFYGLDFSSEAIKQAKGHEFIMVDFNQSNDYPKTDLALIVHTLEHIDNPLEFLEEVKKVSKKVVVAIPPETVPEGEHFSTFDLEDFKDVKEVLKAPGDTIIIMEGKL